MRKSTFVLAWKVLIPAVVIISTAFTTPLQAQIEGNDNPSRQQAATADIKVFSQEDASRVINLPDAIRVALDESFDIYRLEQKYLQLAYGLETARRSLKTRVIFDSTLPKITQGYVNRLYTNFELDLDLLTFDESYGSASAQISVVQPLITNGYLSIRGRMLASQRSMQEIYTENLAELRYVMPRLSFDYSQPLFQFNQIKGQLKEAELDLESLNLSYSEVELRKINDITREFFSLYGRQRFLAIADEIYRQSVINYEAGNRRYDLGLISEMELLSLEVESINSLDRLINTQHQLEMEQVIFNRMIGIEVDEKVWVLSDEEYQPISVDLNRAMELADRNRSDMRTAQIEVEKIDLDIRRTVSDGRPDLQLDLSYDYTGNSTIPYQQTETTAVGWSDHFRVGIDPEYIKPNFNINLSLRVPVFDSRTNDSKVQRLISERNVLERETDEVRDELHSDVIQRVGSVQSAMQRIEMQVRNRQVARNAFEISQGQFERGEISYTEHLLVQRRYLETESLFTDALIEYEVSKAELKEITMWDWETNRPVQQRTTPPEPFGERR